MIQELGTRCFMKQSYATRSHASMLGRSRKRSTSFLSTVVKSRTSGSPDSVFFKAVLGTGFSRCRRLAPELYSTVLHDYSGTVTDQIVCSHYGKASLWFHGYWPLYGSHHHGRCMTKMFASLKLAGVSASSGCVCFDARMRQCPCLYSRDNVNKESVTFLFL